LKNFFKIFQNKYILRSLINNKTKKENNIILFTEPVPKLSINKVLKIKTLINKINNIPINTTSCLRILQEHVEKKKISNLVSI